MKVPRTLSALALAVAGMVTSAIAAAPSAPEAIAPVGGEFLVNSYTTGRQNKPQVALNPDGSFFVTWQSGDQDGDLGGVFGRQFTAAAQPLGDDFQINV
jgi:phosphoheptose isomerase